MKKSLSVVIVLVLVSVCSATTITVCPSGCNYTTIQAGLDAAASGDTVHVYNGTYYEHLTIDKPLNLEGENRYNTIIDGSQSGTCLKIDQDSYYTNVSGFTFQRCNTNVYFYYNDNSTLKDSIIRESTGDSILLTSSNGNTISNNTVYVPNGRNGIYFDNADDNLLESNIITENPSRAIRIHASSDNQIIRNTITREYSPGSFYGIQVWDHSSTNNNFSENDITNFTHGFYLDEGGGQYIYNNTVLHSVNNGLFANTGSESNSIINNRFRYSGIYDIQLLSGSNTIINNSVCKIYYTETTTIQDNICPYSTPPNIQLQSPDNTSLSFNRNNTFKFIAFDDLDNSFNCYFYIGSVLVAGKTILNNTLGEFNYTDMGDNPYTWHVMCNDSDGNNASSEERILEVNVYPPSISNIAPYDGHHTSNNSINITYYTSDYWNISNCSLYGNFTGVWKLNSTDFEVESGRYNSFIVTLDEGEYLWGITCYDGRDLSTITSNRTLYVDNTPPTISLTNMTPSVVEHGSTFCVYVNVTDDLSSISLVYMTVDGAFAGYMEYSNDIYMRCLGAPDLPGKYEINITATDSAGNSQSIIYDYAVRFGTISIDCGSGDDYQSNTSRGYGYLDGSASNNVRYDTDGNVSYLFTLLRPSDSYFFTLKFTDAFSEGGVQTVYFDNQYSGFNVTLSGTQYVYITPNSALYEDNNLTLTIKRPSIGRTLIDEIEMRRFDPIPNTSIDSGSSNDLQYSSSRDYGYLDGSSYNAWGNQSYQTVRYDTDGIVRYQFDNLDQRENYSLNLTFYEGDGAGRTQTAYVGESNGSDPSVNLSDGLIHHIYFDISKDKYYDQSIILYVERAGSGDAIISYLNLISTYTSPTTTSTTTTTSTSTTSTPSTTTSLPIDECPKGDAPPCDGLVDDYELLDYIDLWVDGEVTDYDLLEVIDSWAVE